MSVPGEKWHWYLDPLSGMWLFGLLAACSWFTQRSGEISTEAILLDRYLLLLSLAVFQIPSITRSLQQQSLVRKGIAPFFRSTSLQIVASAASHLPALPLLWLTYGRVWNWPDVGVAPADRFFWCLAAGAVALMIQLWLDEFASRVVAPTFYYLPRKMRRRIFLRDQPRGSLARALRFVDNGFVQPLCEDLIHRGFLVFLLGETCGNRGLAIAAGCLLFVLVHLYQGWRTALLLQIFFWASIGLLYSPFGLVAVMALHVGFYLRRFYYEYWYLLAQLRSLRAPCSE